MTFAAIQMPSASLIPSNGGRLVSAEGRTLPLIGTSVRAEAQGGIARVVLEQRFANPHDEPLRLRYLVPLPEDGAVSAYAFRIGSRTITGVVEPRAKARERFERAMIEGRSAALLDEERGSLFTQTLGNVPPRTEVVCTLTIDQKLVWLDEGAWEWRFPTVVAPRYLGEPGRTPDAPKVVVDVADAPIAPTMTLGLTVRDALSDGGKPSSPSHAIATRDDGGAQRVSLVAERGAALDRDVVVRWPVARPKVGVSIAVGRPRTPHAAAGNAFGLVTIVPPSPDHLGRLLGRDVCLLLDTSGSMEGEPLAQARRVCGALIDTLGDEDQLEMIEFSDDARRWKKTSAPATTANRASAHAWLAQLDASGSTDMTSGILEALATLRPEAQRQVVLVTDGQIGFEREVLAQICGKLPKQSRLHTVGVGDAVNRSLTGPAARAGGGIEVVIGIGEDPERAAGRILRRTDKPLITEVELAGSALVQPATTSAADLFGGAPALVPVQLRADGGELIVRGRTATGRYEQRLTIGAYAEGDGQAALAALWARERVADRELRLAAGGDTAALDAEIEQLGVGYQIATRLTSFVAVSDAVDVDPTAPTRSETMPHVLPHGMSAGGLGLRPAFAMMPAPAQAASLGAASKLVSAYEEARSEPDAFADDSDGASDLLSDEKTRGAPMPSRPRSVSAYRQGGPGAPPAPPRAPAPTPPPQKKEAAKGGSVLQRVRRFLTGARKLRGRVLRLGGDTFAIEITLDEATKWRHPSRIVLRFRDGTTAEVPMNASATTREGDYAAGQIVRAVLQLAGQHDPVEAVLDLPEGELTVVLEEDR